jgi:hypothetical protein
MKTKNDFSKFKTEKIKVSSFVEIGNSIQINDKSWISVKVAEGIEFDTEPELYEEAREKADCQVLKDAMQQLDIIREVLKEEISKSRSS